MQTQPRTALSRFEAQEASEGATRGFIIWRDSANSSQRWVWSGLLLQMRRFTPLARQRWHNLPHQDSAFLGKAAGG